MSSDAAKYILDAGVFIQAARFHYAFDIAPGFWEALIQHARVGTVLSVDRVLKKEIDKGNDELKDWVNNHFHLWFASTADDDVVDEYRRVMQWAYTQTQFSDAAKAEFASDDNADAWLISYALAKSCVVVTHEQFNASKRNKIPIPNVCRVLGVRCFDTFQMLRNLGVRLR